MKFMAARNRKRSKLRKDRGVALIITLLLLMLVTGMIIAMAISLNSDMLVNGYYRNFRGSFYAGDSGINVARQEMLNELMGAALKGNFDPTTTQPIPAGTENTVQQNVAKLFAKSQPVTGAGQSSSSWPAQFQLSQVALSAPVCVVEPGDQACPPAGHPTGPLNNFRYTYKYTLTSVGQSRGNQSATLTESGQFILTANLAPATGQQASFAGWGMFIDQYDICSGTLVPGTITGPVFTNGSWNFGSGTYTFTDPVGQVGSQVGYFDPSCTKVSAPGTSDGRKPPIAPNFQGGLALNQSKLQPPADAYSQERAVLDGIGEKGTVTNTDLHSGLRDIKGNQYPSSGANSGVFLPYDSTTTPPSFKGGGIYIEGNAGIALSAPAASGAQVYTITQNGNTTIVTIDPTPKPGFPNGTTLIADTNNPVPQTISGVPMMVDPNHVNPSTYATMVYDSGNVTALSGVVQDKTAMTVAGNANITISGNVTYKTPPINVPADTVNTTNDNGQALGIFTPNGDIRFNGSGSNNSLEIDASLAAIGGAGTGGLVNLNTSGSPLGTLTIVGGRIQSQIKNINATTRNVYFDRRFGKNGFGPPWFPSTTLAPPTNQNTANLAPPTVQRLKWQNLTSSY